MLTNQRGSGYWIWKPYLILKKLEEISDADIVIYVDAGCELNNKGLSRFDEYINMANKNGNLAFQLCHAEKTWTKFDLVEYMGCTQQDNLLNSGQMVGTIVFFKKHLKIFISQNNGLIFQQIITLLTTHLLYFQMTLALENIAMINPFSAYSSKYITNFGYQMKLGVIIGRPSNLFQY